MLGSVRAPTVDRVRLGPRLSTVWVAAGVLVPVGALAVAPLGAIDLAYQLRLGAGILGGRGIPRVDTFTFTARGVPWLDQQWLAQLLLDLVFRLGGWLGLALSRSALAGLVLALLYLACRARGAEVRPAAWLTLGSGLVLLGGFQLRPQLSGLVCFAAALWLLADRRAHPRRIWLLLPIVAFWANLHGSFFLAPLLILLVLLEDLANREPEIRRLVLLGAASIVASLANPFGLRVWSYVVEISTDPRIRSSVVEWQPPTLGTFTGAAFFLSVAAVVVLISTGDERPSWTSLVWLGLFFLIGLSSLRGVFWWALAAPVTVAGERTALGRAAARHDPTGAANLAIILALAAAVTIATARWLPYGSANPPSELLSDAPLGLTSALRAELRPGERVFNAQAWGSWLEYALPGHPVAADSRIELFPGSVWDAYDDVSSGREGWQEILDRWHVRVLALYAGQQGELIARLQRDVGWIVRYHRGDAWVFVRGAPTS